MRTICLCAALVCGFLPALAEQPTGAQIAGELQHISINPDQTYRVRDLQFSRGDVKIYLNEGILSFASAVRGRIVAAIFTTQLAEAGDAEILLLPPERGERASLASFIKAPNLDEHFGTAVFVFGDDTASELLSQIQRTETPHAPDVAAQNAEMMNKQLRGVVAEAGMRILESLLDEHPPEQGFFYGFFAGHHLGTIDVFYEPKDLEPVTVGQPLSTPTGLFLQLWTSFRPRRAPPAGDRQAELSQYHIDTTVGKDLGLQAVADFKYAPQNSPSRVLGFGLSDHLRVTQATIDGQPAEIFQPESLHLAERERGRNFLLISSAPLLPGVPHAVEVRYQGSVIRQTGNGGYFVAERNVWYPYLSPMRTNFDLTFHIPAHLTLISTGDVISDQVSEGVRVVHRRTSLPEGLAGFNLGDYKSSVEEHGLYRVESYAEKQSSAELVQLVAQKTAAVLDDYSKRWMPLPIHALAVTPIAGTFGQGFPGLIYLSTLAYMRPEDRPAIVRGTRSDIFFSEMMLPHEVAHQWWGNALIAADYRTDWLMEAMPNYSALQVLESTHGSKAAEAVLDGYRSDLLQQQDGRTVESVGPVSFGTRLIETAGMETWHKIIYEKGTWILQMLRERLGDEGFRRMQVKLLEEFRAKPVTNDDFRRVASEYLPHGQPDKDLSLFFDAWVYGTGLPQLSLVKSAEGPSLEVAGVEEDFLTDVPLQCHLKGRKPSLLWIRVNKGSNSLEAVPAGSTCELPISASYLYSQ